MSWSSCFLFFSKIPAFRYFSWPWSFFPTTRLTYASVSDFKSMLSIAHIPWTFPKRLLAFISPHYRRPISKKGWNFFFLLNKNSSRKRDCCKIILRACWMNDSEYLKDCECKTTELKICPKERQFPSILVGGNGFFSKIDSLNSTRRFLKFMTLLRECTPKQLAEPTRRTMGCVVKMNTDLMRQNFHCQKHHTLLKKIKQWKTA